MNIQILDAGESVLKAFTIEDPADIVLRPNEEEPEYTEVYFRQDHEEECEDFARTRAYVSTLVLKAIAARGVLLHGTTEEIKSELEAYFS